MAFSVKHRGAYRCSTSDRRTCDYGANGYGASHCGAYRCNACRRDGCGASMTASHHAVLYRVRHVPCLALRSVLRTLTCTVPCIQSISRSVVRDHPTLLAHVHDMRAACRHTHGTLATCTAYLYPVLRAYCVSTACSMCQPCFPCCCHMSSCPLLQSLSHPSRMLSVV